MSTLIWALGATIIVSLISFVGVFTLALKTKLLKKIVLLLIGFSAGTLLGGALLHLIPEAAEGMNLSTVGLYVLIGFAIFFIIEKILYWRHCHNGKCDVHTFTSMTLLGDSIHNFLDGLVIFASFAVNVPLGIITTIAIIAHEIPQEIGDLGVLIYGGFNKKKALLFNFMTALTAILGAAVGYLLSSAAENFALFILPFAAGGFIYIAASDLVPELHKEPNINKSLTSFVFFLLGIIFMYVIKIAFET